VRRDLHYQREWIGGRDYLHGGGTPFRITQDEKKKDYLIGTNDCLKEEELPTGMNPKRRRGKVPGENFREVSPRKKKNDSVKTEGNVQESDKF